MKNRRNYFIAAGVLVALPIGYFVVRGNQPGLSTDILTVAKKGQFRVEVETTGELEAKNSVKILGPQSLTNFQIWQVTIQKIVNEGTTVKKGDWVATLDRSGFQQKFTDKQIELEKANSKFVQIQLDTTLIMRQARDELINLRYAAEEKKIILQQSQFEPPATIKQDEMALDKANRAYEQAIENYKIKKNQNIEKMREVSAELRKVQGDFKNMTNVLESFEVKAPEDGMIIYEKGWDGRPIKAGSQIQMWDPKVASLPDLTKMISKTYVNEVDVRKVKKGQRVEVGLDAYPDKKLMGTVVQVANVGEQRPNSDAKVFEVLVDIDGIDATLRPSMTTSNKIIASVKEKAVYVPLECLQSEYDSITYVYKKEGARIEKQEVIIAETNANDAMILTGIAEGERLYLSTPPGYENQATRLLPEMNGKRKKKNTEEPQANKASAVSPKEEVMAAQPIAKETKAKSKK